MFFYLSKILLFILKPLVWVTGLLIVSGLTHNETRRKKLIWIACLMLYLCSNPFLINELALLYEDRGTANLQESYEIGLVLGGFSKKDTSLQRTVFYDASDRLLQALHAFHRGRIRKIMISSGNSSLIHQSLKEADAVKEYLLETGIPDSCIIIENKSRNTYENIRFSKAVLDSLGIHSRVLIFSSAWHLPRVRLCLNNNLDADLFATHYLSDRKRDFSPDNLLVPKSGSLMTTELLMKEWIGYVFYLIKVS